MNVAKPEPIALSCLTPGGVRLTKWLVAMLPLTCYTSEALQRAGFIPFNSGFASATHETFSNSPVPIFIGATGITMQVLAPLMNDRFSDPAVVVVDEYARYVISLLSGHTGGANALTRYPAGMLGADPVITTAIDVSELATLDMLVLQLNVRMADSRTAVKTVSQMLVSDMWVGPWCDAGFTEALNRCGQRGFIPVDDLVHLPVPDALTCVTLHRSLPPSPIPYWRLVPQWVVAEIGCRRDIPYSLFCSLLGRQLVAQCPDPLVLKAIGSMSLKTDEPGLRQSAHRCRMPFEAFSTEALHEHEHRSPASSFVWETISAGSVSGPVTWLLSRGNLSGGTLREQGVTITLGIIHWC